MNDVADFLHAKNTNPPTKKEQQKDSVERDLREEKKWKSVGGDRETYVTLFGNSGEFPAMEY